MIHQSSIIDSKAKVSKTARIGPYSVIGSNVEIGDNVEIYSHVSLSGNTIIGEGTNQIEIEGIEKLKKAKHTSLSDRIVAGTYIIAAVILN